MKQQQLGVSKNRGTPKWMVYNGKNSLKWMIWEETPLFLEIPNSFHPAEPFGMKNDHQLSGASNLFFSCDVRLTFRWFFGVVLVSTDLLSRN